MKKILFIISLYTSIVQAQVIDYKTYYFDNEIFERYTLTEKEKKEPELILKDKRIVDLVVKDASIYNTIVTHRIRYINSDEAIERNNRIYISRRNDQEIVKQLIRVKKPNGQIFQFNEKNIIKGYDTETKAEYEYFAIDGLEVGSLIEYISIVKSAPVFNGSGYFMQDKYPKKNVSIDFYIPNYLIYKFKSYNGFPEIKQDSTFENDFVNKYSASMEYVEPLYSDHYMNYNANLKSISYKLIANTSSGAQNLNNFRTFIEKVHEVIYTPLDKKQSKIIDSYIDKSNANNIQSVDEKIRAVEDFMKKNFVYTDEYQNALLKLEEVDKHKTANELTLLALYCNIFKKMGIETEIVTTNSRYNEPFDKEFENYNHLDIYLICFPKQKKYLSIANYLFRYPFIPYQNIDNYGLFINSIELNGQQIPKGKIKFIEALPKEVSIDSMHFSIDFSKNIEKPIFKYERHQTGYSAHLQPIFTYIEKEQQKQDFRIEELKQINELIEPKTVITINDGVENFAKKPFILKAEFETDVFTTLAGKNILFKVGEIIGPQVEIYEEKKRTSNYEISYNHLYVRDINFKIPDGYTLKNTNDIETNMVYKNEDGKEILAFVTKITITNNAVRIHNIEYYDQINLDINKYNKQFRDVVNAAADFNKIVLLLEKN